MNVKSLMLLLAFAGLGASCSDDVESGGGSSIAGRTELQIAFSGNGESQEYTKAATSESENEIKDLKIYLFAANAENGEYQYLRTMRTLPSLKNRLRALRLRHPSIRTRRKDCPGSNSIVWPTTVRTSQPTASSTGKTEPTNYLRH